MYTFRDGDNTRLNPGNVSHLLLAQDLTVSRDGSKLQRQLVFYPDLLSKDFGQSQQKMLVFCTGRIDMNCEFHLPG